MLKATHAGKIQIGALEVPCFVLEDGRRVISGRGITSAIGMKGRGQGTARILAHKTLKPFVSAELAMAIETPISFQGIGNRQSAGYEATILHDLCEAVLSARDSGGLTTPQEQRYAAACDSLVRAFAKVGIVALVDEATGYQAARERDALHNLLAVYLSEERLRWAKTFPDEFYRQLYRLRGWNYPNGGKHSPLVGKITNQVVYEKLPVGVLEELRTRNPTNATTKRRKWKHFQFLSEDIGQIDLRNHLIQLVALMRAATSWESLTEMVDRAFSPDESA